MLKKIAGLTLGALLYAMGIALFLDPHDLAPGGAGGVAILLNRLFPLLDTGTWILVLNIPLLILGLILFGRRFLLSTVYTTIVSSLFISLLEQFTAPFPPVTHNPLLAALAGGTGMALGVGIVFRCGGTTGGIDIPVKLLRRRLRHLPTGKIFLVTDLLVVLLSIPVLGGIEPALYAIVALLVSGTVMDKVLYGTDGGKVFYIITDHPHRIARRIMEELDLGVTYLQGEGAYTGTEKRILFCVAKRQLAYRIRDIVRTEDPHAFLIRTPAGEVVGEGFKSHSAEEL